MAIVPERPPILDLVGGGIKFGFGFNAAGKLSETPPDLRGTKVVENVRFLLNTSPGERLGNPEFGSLVPRLLFEPNDEVLKDNLYIAIVESVTRFEPRVVLQGVGFPEISPRHVGVVLVYNLRGSSERRSASFSFNRG